MPDILKPTLLIDEQIARSNIHRMTEKAWVNDVIFRPHFKTHQSHAVGQWFRDCGVDKITVSSVEMAQYFKEDGWKDITIAFPFNLLETHTINDLAKSVKINLLVESPAVINYLGENLKFPVDIYIKTDLGTHRTGVDPTDLPTIDSLINLIGFSENLRFAGFIGHAGHSYHSRSVREIMEVHEQSRKIMSILKREFNPPVISVGDTPTCSVADDFQWADEIRPGNFVYYDLMQIQIGSCDYSRVAAAMVCPVVACHPSRNEAVIYGGGIHFSKDFIEREGQKVFGQVVDTQDWSSPLTGCVLTRISQEHGVVHLSNPAIDQYREGDLITILPAHSCMTADILKRAYTKEGTALKMMK